MINGCDLLKYSRQYENMTLYKPSYHKVHKIALDTIIKFLPDKEKAYQIADFGAGSGYLTEKIADHYPNAKIYSVEFNGGFFSLLEQRTKNHTNIKLYKNDIEKPIFQPASLDAISMMHVLRLTNNAKKGYALDRAYEALKPYGILIIADLGRELDMKKHIKEIVKFAYEKEGLFKVMQLFYQNIESIRFNRKCAKLEKANKEDMLHILPEFCEKIERHGFKIKSARDDLYLGDDDFVVAYKNK